MGSGKPRIDITGQRFGRLIAQTRLMRPGVSVWLCKCDCGKSHTVPAHSLRSGAVKSCGCSRKAARPNRAIHGMVGTPEYALWEQASKRARKRGLLFSITPKDITIPEFCPLLGTKLVRGRGPNAPSVDRLEASKGYTVKNTWVISYRANAIKNDASPLELHMVADGVEDEIARRKQ
jgi:hypothetical protein